MKKRQYFIVDGKKIPTTKNVKYAAKKLPPEVQNLFLEIWKLIGCMDLYGGHLPDYFQIIKILTIFNRILKKLFLKLN